MTEVDERSRYASVTAGARVFALILLAAPVAFTGDYGPILNVILVAAVWMAAIFVEGLHRIPVMPALVLEASLVTFLAAWTLADSRVLLPALGLPLFIGGLVRGSRGMLEVAVAEIVVLTVTILPNNAIERTADLVWAVFTWLMVGLGFGAIGAIVHNLRAETPSTAGSYRDARALITQLINLSGELVDGLDPVGISRNVLGLTRAELPLTGAVVYTPSIFGPTPLVEGDVATAGIQLRDALIEQVFAGAEPLIVADQLAFPLLTDAGVVAVVAGVLEPQTRGESSALLAKAKTLTRSFTPEAVQLDTALLFTTVRDEATAEERHRLARDLHDGVAQDLAALGYLIDGLEETSTTTEQAEQVEELRSELSKVIAELRRSIFSLRNDANAGTTLG
ncbi:MAG TPA: histidine kinase dimerization/phosphoacceptor domain-containing protein, partial [Nocardioides sp.]